MPDFDIDKARIFVARALPDAPVFGAVAVPDLGFDKAKEQAVVVGSAVLSFDVGVEADFREAVSDSALLAQMIADKSHDAAADPIAWFDAYFDVLGNIGWAI